VVESAAPACKDSSIGALDLAACQGGKTDGPKRKARGKKREQLLERARQVIATRCKKSHTQTRNEINKLFTNSIAGKV